MSGKKIKKALILAAGAGTRFLPASKAIPKLLFPVIDKPIIQIVVEEVVKAGITGITFVLSPFSPEFCQAIRNHFSPIPALNEFLQKSGKEQYLEELKRIEGMANYSFVLQRPGRHGAGTAILSASEQIGNEPFLMLFSDEFYLADPPWITQLLNAYEKYQASILGCIRSEAGDRFGFVVGENTNEKVVKVEDLIEKPGIGNLPSNLASMSGMIFEPGIFDCLIEADKDMEPGRELYHTYGIKKMLAKSLSFYAVEYQNYRYFDTGDKLGYLKAMVELGMEYPSFGEEFKTWLKGLKI